MFKVNRCSAQLIRGRFCDAPTLDDMPFPICHRHASQVWAAFNQTMRAARYQPRPPKVKFEPEAEKGGCIYYIRVGDRIKIGFTMNLKARLTGLSLLAEDVVAVEPGNETDEYRRHQQFAADRISSEREWFHASPDIEAHITELQQKYPDLRRIELRMSH